jgi:hypothetical protein
MSEPQATPTSVDSLQFQRAEVTGQPATRTCALCKQPITGTYFQASGHPVCAICTQRIKSGQQNAPSIDWARATLFGLCAAIAGCAIFAAVWIATGARFGLIAIVVGILVGKAIRYASGGRGGIQQQILAVVLTYFGITASIIPVILVKGMSSAQFAHLNFASPWTWMVMLGTSAISPFMGLTSISGVIYIALIFFGLRQAWALTRPVEIAFQGPYETNAG